MAEGGFDNPTFDPEDPKVPGNDDDDNEDEQGHDETTPFGQAPHPPQGLVVKKSRCKQCITKRADFQTHLTTKSLR